MNAPACREPGHTGELPGYSLEGGEAPAPNRKDDRCQLTSFRLHWAGSNRLFRPGPPDIVPPSVHIAKQMPTFAVEDRPEISGKVIIKDLVIDGINHRDQFFTTHRDQYRKDLISIQSTLESVGQLKMLPAKKWKQLNNGKKSDIKYYEAKSGDLRLYAFKLKPNILLVFGGKKGNQQKDINYLFSIAKQYKESIKENEIDDQNKTKINKKRNKAKKSKNRVKGK